LEAAQSLDRRAACGSDLTPQRDLSFSPASIGCGGVVLKVEGVRRNCVRRAPIEAIERND
jgi:hypothetical protein